MSEEVKEVGSRAIESLDTAIAELITKTVDGADTAVAFLEGQLPEYVYQLMMWHSWSSLTLFTIGVILAITALTIDYKVWKIGTQKRTETTKSGWFMYGDEIDSERLVGGYILLGSAIRMLPWILIIELLNSTAWLKIWIAPKVWLVEYAAKLVS